MGQTSVQREASHATREVLGRIAAGPLGERLRAQLARSHAERPGDEIDEAFQEAFQRGLLACRAEREYEVYSFLRVTMANWLADQGRLEARETTPGDDSPAFLQAPAADPEPPVELARRELSELRQDVLARLSDRQRRVLALHAQGVERRAIAAREQASEKAIKKDLERIFAVGREEIIGRAGGGCQEGERLVSRYAFRLGADWAAAQFHIAGCGRCGRFFASIDAWRDRTAAVLPLPAAETAEPGILAHALERAGEGVGNLRDQIAGGTDQARQQLADSTEALKQHTSHMWYRTVDPTPLSGMRPGAAAAVISGCLALGGGATYCVEQGVDPIAQLVHVTQSQPERPPREAASEPKSDAQEPPDPPQVPATPAPQPPPAPVPAPIEPQPAAQVAPPPAPPHEPPPPPPEQQEFDPAAAAAASAPAQVSPNPQRPARAPETGVGEFLGGP